MKKGSVVHRTLHWCFLCQQYKPIKEFYKDKYKSSGFGGICKSCHTNYQREYLHNYYIKYRLFPNKVTGQCLNKILVID